MIKTKFNKFTFATFLLTVLPLAVGCGDNGGSFSGSDSDSDSDSDTDTAPPEGSDCTNTSECHYLTHATLIDGTGAAAKPNMTILIQGENIIDIFEDGETPLDSSITEEDLSGKFVTPGLIDIHLHTDIGTPEEWMNLVKRGITTFRDPSSYKSTLDSIASAASGPVPQYFSAPIHSGPEFGEPGWVNVPNTGDYVDLAQNAKDNGEDGVKIYSDLDSGQVQRLADAFREVGLEVWCHLEILPATAMDVINSGCTILSHAMILGEVSDMDQVLNAMKEKGYFLDETIDAMATDIEPGEESSLTDAINATKRARELGVKIAAGTDDCLMEGENMGVPALYRELGYLVNDCEFSTMEAIVAATKNNGEALGPLGVKIGTVEIGKDADMVVLTADPLSDIANLKKIDVVFINGQRVEGISS